MHVRGYGPAALERECPKCGAGELHDPRADGEVVRGARCRECGEWYIVHARTEKNDD